MSNVSLQKNNACLGIWREGDKLVLKTEKETLKVDRIISALPAHVLASVLECQKRLKELLSSIKFVDVAVLNLGYNSNVIPFQAFGYLIPSIEKSKALGVIFDSCVFPQQDM